MESQNTKSENHQAQQETPSGVFEITTYAPQAGKVSSGYASCLSADIKACGTPDLARGKLTLHPMICEPFQGDISRRHT